jgi:predicted amidohydrolase
MEALNMKIEILQYPIAWESRENNFATIQEALRQSPPEPGSMLVLPEMFSTGFSMNVETFAETTDGPSSTFLRELALRHGICTVGSFPFRCPDEASKGLNRLLAFAPDGTLLARYDKIHPFTYGQEAKHYLGGQRLPLFDYGGWRVCPTICYDLRFPEMYRRAVLDGGADLILVIANWPSRRREHWNALLRARAIENQAVVVGVNRVGEDPTLSYAGDSAVIDMLGKELLVCDSSQGRHTVALDHQALLDWRAQFPALQDATNAFELELPNPVKT